MDPLNRVLVPESLLKTARSVTGQLVYIIEHREHDPGWRDPSWMDSDLQLLHGAGPHGQEGESDLDQDMDIDEESVEEESGWWSDGVRPFEEDLGVPPPIMPQAPVNDADEPPALSDTESDSEDEEDDADHGCKQAPKSTIKFIQAKGKGRSSCRRETSDSEDYGSDSDSSQEDGERRE